MGEGVWGCGGVGVCVRERKRERKKVGRGKVILNLSLRKIEYVQT